MWEYRVVWTSSRPAWWREIWERGEHRLRQNGEKVEERPDTYLVLSGRVDVGLKLRGDSELEVKSLHARIGNWELWEKCPYFKWNALEVVRFANMLRVEPPKSAATAESVPVKGVEEFLRHLGIESTTVQVRKRRLQAAAAELLAGVPTCIAAPSWLAELVEIHLPHRSTPIMSLCLETLEPLRGGIDPLITDGAVRCGYPELLVRHMSPSL